MIILTIMLSLSGCSLKNVLYEFGFSDYNGWQTVEIDNTGIIKIPEEWEKKESNNLFYFCDKNDNNKILLFQSKSNVGIMSDPSYENGVTESNIISNEFQALSELSCESLYSDCVIAKTLVKLEDEQTEMKCIKMLYTTLYVYDNNIEDDVLYKIAYSLVKNENSEFLGYR